MSSIKLSALVVLVVVLSVGTIFGVAAQLRGDTQLERPAARPAAQPVAAQQPGGAVKGNHTVVMTDGTHLVVTDNKTDTLYFYSIEKDAEIGSDLKLRGKVDLGQVGKDVITPVVMFKKKKD